MKVDVLMCLYDVYWDKDKKLFWIKQSVSSILNQTFTDFRFLIVSDGASKEAVDLLKSFKDNRIVLYEREHKGRASALDFGISKCKAEFIAFQDGDDISTNDRLEKQLALIESDERIGCVGCWYCSIDENGKVLGFSRIENPNELPFGRLAGAIGTAFYRKKALDEMGSFRFDVTQDYYSFVKLRSLGWKLANVNNILWMHRVHKGSLSSMYRNKQVEVEKVIRKEIVSRAKISAVLYEDRFSE